MPARRIVAIDFDAQIGERLRAAFAPPEFDFHWFASGRQALEALPLLQPDAIVCEVMLPDIDGRAVLEAVKRSPELMHVPFLILSGVRSESTVRAALDAGAEAFLLKPFPVSQLVQAIRKVLNDPAQDGSDAPAAALPRAPGHREGPIGVARAKREAATSPPAARGASLETASRQRIGFETRDPLPEPARPEPSAPPMNREPARSPDSAASLRHEPEEAEVVAPIRLEGRISSFELAGARVRVLTEAEGKGQHLVVRTTVTRDGKELRSVETAWDHPLQTEEDESALKELIGVQHAGALEDVRRLLTPHSIPQEVPAPALETPPVPEAPPLEPPPSLGAPEEARPGKVEKRKRSSRRRALPREPASVDAVVLMRGPEAEPAAVVEQLALPAPEVNVVDPPLRPSAGKRIVLLAVAAVLIALAFLFGRPPAAISPEKAAAKPEARPSLPASATLSETPGTSSPAEPAPVGLAPERKDVAPPAQVGGGTAAGFERVLRGRRDWAQGLYDAGRYGEASAALNEVFKLAPSDPEARRLAANIQAALAARAAIDGQQQEESAQSPSKTTDYPGWVKVNPPPPTVATAEPVESPPREEAARGAQAEQDARELQETKSAPAVESRPSDVQGTLVKLGEPGVVAPVVESRPALGYPPVALHQRAEGSVDLRALVDEAGLVTDALVVGGPDGKLGFKEAAVDYVKAWRFAPARKNGVPVKVWVSVRIDYRLPR